MWFLWADEEEEARLNRAVMPGKEAQYIMRAHVL
jgi:hypothetical protein